MPIRSTWQAAPSITAYGLEVGTSFIGIGGDDRQGPHPLARRRLFPILPNGSLGVLISTNRMFAPPLEPRSC
jgi:hypothetical protein